MDPILQNALPFEMQGETRLPGVGPCEPDDWLRVDEAYARQMAYRTQLLAERGADVLRSDGEEAEQEVLEQALALLPGLGFEVDEDSVLCPDGRRVALDRNAPLCTMGHLVQQDICVLQKRGDQHVLTGAVLCFPANWRLAEKIGRPLTDIHTPVDEYDENIARRVQRLLDGIKVGRPLWRYNRLEYATPELHQPGGREKGGVMRYLRAERQCLVRMPQTKAVAFAIHTFFVRRVGM